MFEERASNEQRNCFAKSSRGLGYPRAAFQGAVFLTDNFLFTPSIYMHTHTRMKGVGMKKNKIKKDREEKRCKKCETREKGRNEK